MQNTLSKLVKLLQNNSLLGKTWVRNVCAKFTVDPLNRFRTVARQVFTTQKLFPSEIPLTMKIATTNSDQITICQISFEIFDVKQIST